jgi:hypothetical protein
VANGWFHLILGGGVHKATVNVCLEAMFAPACGEGQNNCISGFFPVSIVLPE